MANLNKVMLIGRLTRDPETRTFSNGGKVAKFGFAVNNRKKNPTSGQWEDDPVFLDVEAFNRGDNGTLADRVASLRKGQQVFIEGHLKLDQWTAQDGQKRSKITVVVDNLQYLEPRGEGGMGGMGDEGAPVRTSRMNAAPAPRRTEPSYSGNGGSYGGGNFNDEPAEPSAPPAEDDIPF